MNSDLPDPNSNKCLYQTSDGRTCRMLRKKGHPSFCIHHAREEQQRLESEKLAAEFASLSGKTQHRHGHKPRPRQSLHRPSRKTHLAPDRRHLRLPRPAPPPINSWRKERTQLHPPKPLECADTQQIGLKLFRMNRSGKPGGDTLRCYPAESAPSCRRRCASARPSPSVSEESKGHARSGLFPATF